MTKKEYLGKAYRVDARINSKLEQIASLRSLATKATSSISAVPVAGSRNLQSMESIILAIVSLEEDIQADIRALVELKQQIMAAIAAVGSPELQTLLELRYLCFKGWEQIAEDLGYSLPHIFRLHDKALGQIKLHPPETGESM